MKKETLTFYGTGDESYELFAAGVEFLRKLRDASNCETLRDNLRGFLRRSAQLSKKDYDEYFGDSNDPNADKATVEID